MEYSLESIRTQPTGKYQILDDLFTSMRNDVILERSDNYRLQKVYGGKLTAALMGLFGLKTQLHFSNIRNANVIPLYANSRHVLASANFRKYLDNNELKHTPFDEAVKDLRKHKGIVDIYNAKVGGAFSKYSHEVNYDMVFFFKTLKVSPRSGVAILLHELGHAFHFMEYNDRSHDVNVSLHAAALALRDNDKKKYEYIVKDMGVLDDATINDIVTSPTRQIFTRKLSMALYDTMKTYQTNQKYSEVSNERLADNFASRCGYGTELATTLIKWEPNPIWVNNATNSVILSNMWTMSVFMLPLWFIVGVPWVGLLGILAMSSIYTVVGFNSDNIDMTYDTGIHRYRSIRDDAIQQLKQYRGQLSKPAVIALLYQYDAIDGLINNRLVHNTLRNVIANLFSYKGRSAKEDIAHQRLLEGLVNNPMFVESIKLTL